MQELRGGTAVVTGAASGIGLALAKRFAVEGMNLVVCDIEKDPLGEAARELEGGGVEVLASVVDVADPAAVEELAVATEARFGVPRILCNNAGVATGGLTWDISPEMWDWILGVNLKGVVNGIRAFVSRMVAGGGEGHVVNTASVAGLVSAPLMSPYCVTKHGVVTLSECLAGELEMVGADIGVSVLCPGWVATRIHESDRNLPEGVPQTELEMAGAMREAVGQVVSGGMDPARIADDVIEAIRTKRFYIRTHPGMEGMVAARCEAVVAGTDPAFIGPFDITQE